VKRSKADRMYSKGGADAAWEEEMRREIERKKRELEGKTGPELTKEEKEKLDALLAKESAIRVRVVALNRRLNRGLSVVRALAAANKAVVNAQLPLFYPAVLALSRSPLVADDARLTLDWLARCADKYEYRSSSSGGSLTSLQSDRVTCSCHGGYGRPLQRHCSVPR
jgi:hypothetical protein